jgi:hypothetical protein
MEFFQSKWSSLQQRVSKFVPKQFYKVENFQVAGQITYSTKYQAGHLQNYNTFTGITTMLEMCGAELRKR